jgi:hypothetical protein
MDTLDGKHLICLIEANRKVPHTTDAELVEYIKFNLEVLQSGVHPNTDYLYRPLDKHRDNDRYMRAGTPLAQGWRAAFWGWQGDIKEKVKQHKFARNWQCNFLCERCLACRHLPCGNAYNFNDDALWRQLEVDHAQYLRSTPAGILSPWVRIPGWRLDRNCDDLLHMVWLGFAKDLIGQLLFELASLHPGCIEDGLLDLTKDCRTWFRARRIAFNTKPCTLATISLRTSRDYPTVETKMKAAKTKMVFLWLSAKVVALAHDDVSEFARMRGEMCWCLSNVVHIMDRGAEFLSHDDAREVHKDGNRFLQLYVHFASVAMHMQIPAYKVSSWQTPPTPLPAVSP